jgi:hypothetical protein
MSVSANVCGNCANFKPNKGDKFFNCTYAKQGGVKYAMQVRADTRSCEAFAPLSQPPKPGTTAQPKTPTAKRSEPRPGGLCPWGRIVMLAAIIILILLIAFGAYTCFKGSGTSAPTPTPTLAPTPGPTPGLVTPNPTPTPVPVFQYNMGDLVSAPPLVIILSSAEKNKQYNAPGPHVPPAGASFLFVTLTTQNASAGTIYTGAIDFTIISKSGLTSAPIPPMELPFLFYNAYVYNPSGLPPGQITSGRIGFVVLDGFTDLWLQTSTPDAIVQWRLPW